MSEFLASAQAKSTHVISVKDIVRGLRTAG